MKSLKIFAQVLSVLMVLVGGLWIGQGLNIIRWPADSFMIGVPKWSWNGKVDVLNSELQALEQPQAGAVHQRGGEIGQASQVLKDEGDFGAGENHGNADSAFGADEVGKVGDITADDVSVQEEKRTEGLVLRGGSDPS